MVCSEEKSSVVTVPKNSSISETELKSDPISAAKMEIKSVKDPLIFELVPNLVPHFLIFFCKGGGLERRKGFWRGWTGGSAEQIGAMSLFIFILLTVKN